jgi:hypothetical protein
MELILVRVVSFLVLVIIFFVTIDCRCLGMIVTTGLRSLASLLDPCFGKSETFWRKHWKIGITPKNYK